MPFDPNRQDMIIGVVGTGTMGRGIVQVSAQGGMSVIAYDEKPGAAQAAKDFIAKLLGSQVEKGRLAPADAEAALGRITVSSDLRDMARAHCVVEAIFERLDIKQEMFARLDEICGPRDDHRLQHVVAAGDGNRRQVEASRAASGACTSSIPCR